MSEDNITTERANFVTHLECSATGETLPAGVLHNLSAAGKPLLVRYDLDALRARFTKANLAGRIEDLWRYRELLPVTRPENIVSLGETMTPILAAPRLAR